MEGQRVTGTLSAQTERDAIAQLSSKSLFPLEVNVDKPKQTFSLGSGRVKGQLLATTYSQMASLLRSGVPLLRTLKILEDQSSNAKLSSTLEDVHHRVEDGATLGDAMGRHENVFGELGVSMIRAGGEGGFLEDALDRVAAFTEQQEDLKSRTTGALAYPVFLATVGTLVLVGMLVFFVPNFAPIFDDLRNEGELPALTDYLLFTSDLFGRRRVLRRSILATVRKDPRGTISVRLLEVEDAIDRYGIPKLGSCPILPSARDTTEKRRTDSSLARHQS
jgi:general secretion pathway protein F/type IV pilus assembly protein PilC